MREGFRKLAYGTAETFASPWAFAIGVAAVIVWAVSGPFFGYSDTWQLIINTGTSIATFLMIFLVQHTQNRDARVMQLKLDELIRAVHAARTELVGMEGLTDDELDGLKNEFERLKENAAKGLAQIEASRRRPQPNPQE